MESQKVETSTAALPSHEDFEDRLCEFTQLPAARMEEFLGWSEEQVRQEARTVTRVLKRFAQAVARSMDEAHSMDDFLHELDLKTITRDHDWRAIFSAIRDCHLDDNVQYKRTTLIKYLQYLSFRKRLLDYIFARKAGLAETDEMPAAHAFADASDEPDGDQTTGVISPGFVRATMGEMVCVDLANEEVLEVVLGRNMFELVGGPHPYLVDENGVTCFVKHGRNVVGRHPESDLAVDANFSHVSRAHLVLEWDGAHGFSLMDLSSRGTWLRDEVLGRAARELSRAVA